MSEPVMSVVVVAYDMARELPRTLTTLSTGYQRGGPDVEVIVVDNGSPVPVDPEMVRERCGGRVIRLDPAPPSPAHAANVGIAAACAELVAVLIDGARMVSPGFVELGRRAAGLSDRAVVSTLAFHLGHVPQMQAQAEGYDQEVEDALLASVDWERDGNELFAISTLAGSSRRGWFGPMGESNGVIMSSTLWEELDGFDEAFDRPGGGLVNHDLYARACALSDVELVVLLGEGTFHQFHGGAATGGQALRKDLWAEYESIRGVPHTPPLRSPIYLGQLPETAVAHLDASIRWRVGHGSYSA